MDHTKFNVTNIEEKAKESKGMSSSAKSRHSDDSGPGEKWGVFNFARKIMYVCSKKQDNEKYQHLLYQVQEGIKLIPLFSSLGLYEGCLTEQKVKEFALQPPPLPMFPSLPLLQRTPQSPCSQLEVSYYN